LNARQQAWKESGPIRQWRAANKVTLAGMASALGVTQFTVQMWENGNHKPGEDNAAQLAQLIPDFASKWDAWMQERPSLVLTA
jgi:DNA-binding transcriptional regulator YiaG